MLAGLLNATKYTNWNIRGKCTNEKKAFCTNMESGTQAFLICLNFHKNEDGFSAQCKAALASIPNLNQMTPNVTVSSNLDELKQWLRAHRSFMDRWGFLLLAGSMGFVAMLTFAI